MDEEQSAVEQVFDDVAEAELESGSEETPPEPVTAVRMRDLLIAGLVFTWHRIRHRSVWPAIGCHVTYNATLMLVFLISWYASNDGGTAI